MNAFSSRPLPPMLAAFLAVAPAAAFRAPAGELQTFPGAAYVASPVNDGDSFLARFDGQTNMVRLYFVDCPETAASTDSDRRRVLEQARYFGVDDVAKVVAAGRDAARFTRAALSGQAFLVHTAYARALGRSRKPRVYAMITPADGRDLAAMLVEAGLARAHGVRRGRPDGTSSEDYAAHLADLELAAALARRGVWRDADPAKIAALRQQQRDEDRELRELTFGVFSTVSEDHPLDLNAATIEELQQLRGIGPVLAERIVAGRPYATLEDLQRVDGIGRSTIEAVRPYVRVGASKR